MTQSILAMAKDLVLAQVKAGSLPPEGMQDALRRTYASLASLKSMEGIPATPSPPVTPEAVDWKKSIARHAITCLVCGATFKQLSGRHLHEHGLDRRSYRTTFGIPRTQPLAAKAMTARRKQIVQQSRPWEKSPRFLQAQRAKAKAASLTRKRRTSTRTTAVDEQSG